MKKYVSYAIYAMLFLIMIMFFKMCGISKREREMNDSVKVLEQKMDSIQNDTKTIDVKMKIEGYEISKRMLYDQNAIVRTVIRPDDRMNQYDSSMKALRSKIE